MNNNSIYGSATKISVRQYVSTSWIIYCHVYEWTQTEFGLVVGFTELLQNVTANKGYAVTVVYNSLVHVHRSSQFAVSTPVLW
jgi:hypothetical protein